MSYKPISEHRDDVQSDALEIEDGPRSRDFGATTSKPVDRRYFKSANAVHTAISVAAGTVMTLFGYEQGVFGGIILGEDFLEYFNHPTPGMQGFVTSVYDLGCFGGALIALGIFIDYLRLDHTLTFPSHWRKAWSKTHAHTLHNNHGHWHITPNGFSQHESNGVGTSDCWYWQWRQYCYCTGVARRDLSPKC